MIAYIKGQLTYKNPAYVIIEAADIGYEVNISLHTYEKIQSKKSCTLLTYLQVREDAQTLYGFADQPEKDLFLKLISVSGIGANGAQKMLSSIPPQDLRQIIVNENIEELKKVKGVGPKTAKRVLLELKDKLVTEDSSTEATEGEKNQQSSKQQEVISALVELGFTQTQARKKFQKVTDQSDQKLSVEELIKLALQ